MNLFRGNVDLFRLDYTFYSDCYLNNNAGITRSERKSTIDIYFPLKALWIEKDGIESNCY
jgi:hypothetical protein